MNKNIGLTYLPSEYGAVGTEFEIIIREKPAKAKVVSTPFYRREKRI
jgi:aminomethyltransferase